MRKILFILFLVVSVIAQGQRIKISNLPVASDPDSDDVMIINEDNTTSQITKSLLQADLRDSLINILTRIAALESGVYGGPLPTGLQAYYKFETNLTDETAYNRTATGVSGFHYNDRQSNQLANTGVLNDTSYATTPSIDLTSDYTVMVDVIVGDPTAVSRFLLGNMASNDGFELRMNPGTKIVSYITGDGVTVDSTYTGAVFNVDTIYPYQVFRIAATSDGRIYIDGDSVAVSGSIVAGSETSSTIRIGLDKAGNFNGGCFIDNVKLFAGLLDSAEVKDEYFLNEYYTSVYNPPPTYLSGQVVANVPNVIQLYFSEPLYNYKDSVNDALNFTVNDSVFAIDSSEIDYSNITLYTDSVAYGDQLEIDYNAAYYSGLEDFDARKMVTFYNGVITNNLEAGTDSVTRADIYYKFENNDDDDANDYDLSDTAAYYDAVTFKGGAYSARTTGNTQKYWIPDNFVLGDTFSISVWVYPTNASVNGQVLFTDPTKNVVIELDILGDDIDFWVNGAEAAANNITYTMNGWNHFVFTYATGTVTIYQDNVAETDDATAGTGGSFAGPYRIAGHGGSGNPVYGYIDNFQLYNEYIMTAADVSYLNANPDSTLNQAGSGGTPDSPPPDSGQTAFDAAAIVLLGPFDFEDETLGEFTLQEHRDLFNGGAQMPMEGDAYSGTSGTNRPYIVSYDYDSASTTLQSKGVRYTHPANQWHWPLNSNDYFTPVQMRIPFGPVPQDPTNIDVYLNYNIKHFDSNDWDNLSTQREWKTLDFGAGYLWEGVNGTRTEKVRWHTDDDLDYTSYTVVGKPINSSSLRFKTYPTNGTLSNGYIAPWSINVPGPGGVPTTHVIDVATEPVTNLTIRIYLGTPNVADGFYEVFINGKFSYRLGPMIVRGYPEVICDLLVLKYHWGGNSQEDVPTTSAQIIYDDIVVFKYREEFSGAAFGGAHSRTDRELLLPGWNTTGGYKKQNYQ